MRLIRHKIKRIMSRVILRIAIYIGIALSVAQPSLASDIVCETNFRSNPAQCSDAASSSADCPTNGAVRSKGERIICDYAMLANGYEHIYEDQQKLLLQGRISDSEIAAWRARRDACDSVSCLDGLFAEWGQRADRRNIVPIAPATISGTPPAAQQAPEAESFPVRQFDASPSGQLPASKEAQPGEPPASAEISPAPEPSSAEAASPIEPAAAPSAKSNSSPLANLMWLGFIGIAIALAITPKRDRRFKTGYKNNRTVPTAVPILYGLSVVALLVGFLVK